MDPTSSGRDYDCVQTDDASACMVCLDCVNQAREYPGLCKVGEKKGLFNFCVESTGALRPQEIVLRAARLLRDKLDDVQAKLRTASDELDASMNIG